MAVTVEYLRECFDLDHDTGIIRWRVRPRDHFTSDHGWYTTNGRSAGKVVGTKSSKGYLGCEINGVSLKVHRIVYAMANGTWPANEIDHVNGKPDDNRPSNLRDVPGIENVGNKGMYRRNVSGIPNISERPQTYLAKRWHVQIVRCGIKHQAYFATLEEALEWRDKKRIELGFHPNHGTRPVHERSKSGHGR